MFLSNAICKINIQRIRHSTYYKHKVNANKCYTNKAWRQKAQYSSCLIVFESKPQDSSIQKFQNCTMLIGYRIMVLPKIGKRHRKIL